MNQTPAQKTAESSSDQRVCVVTAADIEFKTVAGLLTETTLSSVQGLKVLRGRVGSLRVTLLQAEIGALGFQHRLAAHLKQSRCDGLLVIGLSGALAPELRTGAVVLYDECFKQAASTLTKKPNLHDTAGVARCDNALTTALHQNLGAAIGCQRVAAVTVDRMVTQSTDKLALGNAFSAVSVDMESFDVAELGARLRIPTAVVRVVLDEAGQDTPDFNRALTPDGKMRGGPLVLVMAARPLVTARFLRSLRPALRALRGAAQAALSEAVWDDFAAAQGDRSRARAKPSPVDNSPAGR